MKDYISDLDCKRFGIKIAKINAWENLDIVKSINELRNMDVQLVITKVPSHQVELINRLEDNGFRIKDTQITYRYDISKLNIDSVPASPDFQIRESTIRDVNEMADIAYESFIGYGHYYADERLNKEVCSLIYPDWARRSCLDQHVADKIFVAESEGRVIGFLSFKVLSKASERYAAGGMGAVAKKFRKFGVFQRLVLKGLIWGAEIGLAWEEHNVLTTNFPVNRVFSTSGFVNADSFMTLHGWLDNTSH